MKKQLTFLLCLLLCVSAVSCEENPATEVREETTSASREQDLRWKSAYLDLIDGKQGAYREFALVYVDGDDIPELYMRGVSQATGDLVCSYQQGTVAEQPLKRCGGGRYLERGGKILNENGNMGHVYTDVYTLTEQGFTRIFSATSVERVEGADGDYTFAYDYTVEGEAVSEEAYRIAVNAAFDFERGVGFPEVLMTYDEIRGEIEARG